MQLATKPVSGHGPTSEAADHRARPAASGLLIINADDWGRDRSTTDRTLECVQAGAVSSVSAMVLMDDSERAAALSREHGIDTGLHLNFTTPFSASGIPNRLEEHQQRLGQYLLRSRFSQVIFHPGLVQSFEYVVSAQFAEFTRLYGREPQRLDGHHHMHLCANVVFAKLLPSKTLVRRNFYFGYGEKNIGNLLYRKMMDRFLERRHHLVDFLFSLPPLKQPGRLHKIFSMTHQFMVELECHPVTPDEYKFLTGGELFRQAGKTSVAAGFESLVLSRATAGQTS